MELLVRIKLIYYKRLYRLARLSERIAQNERTLFTFISSPGTSTLPAFLDKYNDDRFDLITPDVIFVEYWVYI